MKKSLFFLISITLISSCGGGGGGGQYDDIPFPITINPSIDSFSSNNYNVTPNESFIISWTTSMSISCEASGEWTGSKNVSGSQEFILSEIGPYIFILTCTGENGVSTIQDSITINVSSNGSYSSQCKTPSNDSNEYWLEDFNNPVLDSNIFTYQVGNGFFAGNQWIAGWGNNEPQYYTGSGSGNNGNYAKNYNSTNNTTENLFIENGYLKIQPIYNINNPFIDPYNGTTQWQHTSARLVTSNKKIFQYPSKLTVCFKVPDGTGFWPAIWMLPEGFIDNNKVWPDDGEIDLMEARGRLPQVIGSAIHFKANWGSHSFLSTETHVDMENNFQDVFHSVTFEWRENSIKMYLDNSNEPFYEEDSESSPLVGANYPFNEPFYLLLNVASGGNFDSAYETNTEMFCFNEECSNLSIPDRGRFLIDYIEYKSID
mgnify:CR=1 FL=1|tara:strand:- start:1327 stop:2613 length:1287 start_codon:yes stop_codon:yes gene_type:complete